MAEMDQQDAASTGGGEEHGLGRQLQENSMEYMIFILDQKLDGIKYLNALEAVRKDAIRLMDTTAKNYIWQRDAFNLELVNDKGMITMRIRFQCNLDTLTKLNRLGISPRSYRLWGCS